MSAKLSSIMMNLAFAFSLLLVALTAIAIYVQVTSSTLSLPLSTGTTALTIILPLLAAANVFLTPLLRRILPRAFSSPAIQQLLPASLHVIQGILTVVLATLAAEGFVPGQALECGLEGNWQRLYSAKDWRAIERIQDAFNCCGLHSIKDKNSPDGKCLNLNQGRNIACLNPWRAAEQRNAGFGFSVVVVVGILQLIHLAFFRLRNSGGPRARNYYRHITQSIGGDPREGLLENGTVEDGADEDDGTAGEDGTDGGRRDYRDIDDGPSPRIEPSGLGNERNNWA
ncbi:hypothetical protein F4804DRAFT_327988 [Jackrogersella minutella]|nr:hypothetical protein F4804DRAFT_327988 [Jackrogersella minutella]